MKPIRGGTDGSRLTEMGIPTPNLFTGGYNYHSRFEWASVSEMALAVETIINLALIWAE
jgi:tripeptide aminopeptidase